MFCLDIKFFYRSFLSHQRTPFLPPPRPLTDVSPCFLYKVGIKPTIKILNVNRLE